MNELEQNKPLFEKVLLAYWFSIPYDNDSVPDGIKIIKEYSTSIAINLMKGEYVYGVGSIKKYEIERYLNKLNALGAHQQNIISRIEGEYNEN
jgi:hypothetical protein